MNTRPSIWLRYISLPLISFLAASCATRGSRAPYVIPVPENCTSFVETIHSCAAKAHHRDLEKILSQIARCETGNKCTGQIDSLSGEYHGAFQFLRATWEAQCLPVFARRQIAGCDTASSIYDVCCASICASEIIAHGGIHNWPACGKGLH